MAVVPRSGRMIHDSSGNEVPMPLMTNELGTNTPYHALPFEQNTELFPRITALRTFERMKRTDVQVRNSLKICKFPILGGDWYVEPASDSDQDKMVAEFVEDNLFDNLTTPWQAVVLHTLSQFDYGFSILEEVFEEKQWRSAEPNSNSRPMVMLRKLAPRPALSVDDIVYDEYGGPVGIIYCKYQTDYRYADFVPGMPVSQNTKGVPYDQARVFIPIEKLVIFTHDKDGGDLFGQSVLRTAWPHWNFKQHLYKIDAIQKERHGIGIPDIGLPPGYDDEDLRFAGNLARNMRINEHGFILRPPGWEVGFAKPEGQLTDALKSAEHHNTMISLNVLMQFIDPAVHEARGTSATAFDLLLKSLRQEGIMLCEGFNQHCIPQLVDLNFKVARYPKLGVRGIGQARDQQMLAAAIRNLVSVNALSIDDSTEVAIRKWFDLPPTWDKEDDRVNEMLIKPFATPTGVPLQQGQQNPGGGGATNLGLATANAARTARSVGRVPGVRNSTPPKGGIGRGPMGGNQPKATTEG